MVDQIQIRDAEETREAMSCRIRSLAWHGRLLLDQMAAWIGETPASVFTMLTRLTVDEMRVFAVALIDLKSYSHIERWLTRYTPLIDRIDGETPKPTV